MPEQTLPDPYDGLPIVKVEIVLKGAGDGLSKALATSAMKLHHGEQLIATMDVEVVGTTIKPLDAEDPRGPQKAKYELKAAGRATFVDESLRSDVDGLLAKQQAANDAAAGRPQLPLDGPDAVPAALPDGDDPSVPSPGMDAASADVDRALAAEPDFPEDEDGYADPDLAEGD